MFQELNYYWGPYRPLLGGLFIKQYHEFFVSSSVIHPPQCRTYTPGFTTQMPVRQIPLGEAQTLDQNTRQIHKVEPSRKSVVSRLPRPQRETTQDRIQRTHTQFQYRNLNP